ncbi:Enzyme that catalyzes the fourth step in the histidine pathway [Tieghemiomyces parasiticus]|uniref:1-(5-phosphoribosyl)-5-[(5-phosphoribosylamino)methylideneamino] imidazole-4-carboxamide isomerase n=1 Tax=Tieghemiomyces parasiticus TaxID=78921 RepID=A0A9W8E0B0_9FUNG|nr:Enzyme that catalyzes the fourth step in the histidine pathway [Tieghemiomyces parasiticus]
MANPHRRTQFRPCIDLHDGQVKQIVGGTLQDKDTTDSLRTNFVSGYYAELYRKHSLTGAHVIKLGPRNDEAALEALRVWPDGLQLGGGVNLDNAQYWIDQGAHKVIVTSWLFPDGQFSLDRLRTISARIGPDRLVVDLSCRKVGDRWFVAMNKWQTITDTEITQENLSLMAGYCSEFLIHAADVEGLCQGIDQDLVEVLGRWSPIPTTYAGGAHDLSDLTLVDRLSNGRVDLTFGSALDIFGGTQVRFVDCVAWNRGDEV